MSRLANKIAIVTGAASQPGLGSSIARRFAEEGAVVYCTDMDEAGAKNVADSINANGGTAVALKHDVADAKDWDKVFAKVKNDHGTPDILVNNAGIAVLHLIEDLTDEGWDRQLRVNLDSVFYGTRGAVAALREAGKPGSIINISSVGGIVGVPTCTAYSATKGGVRLMTKTVAIECAAQNIRVNSVHPGMIDTNMQNEAKKNPDIFESVVGAVPMQRMGAPEDIANACLFLASDESRYVTGAELVVDGGLTAQ
ncbi:glucose 1-dehydrogenase [Erythrobacter sp. SCSIO 43205]|uniref:SDR family NAD(P)-dependent oxidoreductase n=1 Tax=Erythrobacter sp. SCSIO 43205 TaxID=2779361 RepID=UPI001CA8A028|nr:glucose 1-dehydrogenase [Erythrobacter sp. SCSIO 43205]UAB79307.1 glucose 1-dehydrogenase [Erythrobacter sp. SCSIO 43205]